MGEDTQELPGDPDLLEAEIARRRERLAATIDELAARAKPQAIAHDAVAGAKATLTSVVRTPAGGLRITRIAAVAAALGALLALALAARQRRSR